ncbi:CDP-alcohol phosphatidyltransferase family protein, partial [Roseobacter litoralis]|uniref:CDP-alcohol phosphatidyltransferase family protein n=1 Tax=Roseobacter litoralis TaxID=42443 RepID=UPI00249545F3
HRSLGMGNGVTLIRAALVAVLAGAVVDAQPATWAVFALACMAFALDGLDGWLARRSGLTSAFGARFDMEIDALLGAVLALILLTDGHVGPEILFLGFTRYAFVVASLFLPKLRAALPDSLRRKTICVIQIAALIALICPLTPLWLMAPLSWGAAGLLLWSFASDTRWLLGRP